MPAASSKRTLEKLLAPLEVKFNGPNPWDMQIHENRFYDRVLSGGSLALGESYMDGWWDCEAPDKLFHRILSGSLDTKVINRLGEAWSVFRAWLSNRQSVSRAHRIGEHHYDIGNDLYRQMLDRRMIYSCAYWSAADDLDQAQEDKLELICRKLGLREGQRLLDIGCGWGGLAAYAADKYGVDVVGLTVSKAQADLACRMCQLHPVDIRLMDYRSIDETFDAIVSVGMFEHVGHKNYRTYMEVAHRSLKPGGVFLLHTIGSNNSFTNGDPWIEKYIFPDSMLPSARQITKASEGLFVIEDWHSFGADYDKTLMAWHGNFNSAWPELEPNYGERFGRMWSYYLLCCAGSFRARKNQLWQIVLSKGGLPDGYPAIR